MAPPFRKGGRSTVKRDPANPEEWLRRAKSNLARAKVPLNDPDILLEDLCFDAQQAAEKALKAVAVALQVPLRKTHSLVDLFDLLGRTGIRIPEALKQAGRLTVYAVETRYPGIYEDVDIEEYKEAVRQAELVLRWAEEQVALLKAKRERG